MAPIRRRESAIALAPIVGPITLERAAASSENSAAETLLCEDPLYGWARLHAGEVGSAIAGKRVTQPVCRPELDIEQRRIGYREGTDCVLLTGNGLVCDL